MKSNSQLTGSHLRTYQTIFQHPVSHNLGWHEVHALFRQLGEVEVEPNGNIKVVRQGEVLILHAPRTKEVGSAEELMALRHFLERSETPVASAAKPGARWLVVIDHHAALVYRAITAGAVPQQIRPHMTDDSPRHAPATGEPSRDGELSHPNRFFEPLAAVLTGAGEILLFGRGTGSSSAMEQFAEWLKKRRPRVAQRIVGAVVINGPHLTEAQVLARAQDCYAATACAPR